jgi:hypothetical protein
MAETQMKTTARHFLSCHKASPKSRSTGAKISLELLFANAVADLSAFWGYFWATLSNKFGCQQIFRPFLAPLVDRAGEYLLLSGVFGSLYPRFLYY